MKCRCNFTERKPSKMNTGERKGSPLPALPFLTRSAARQELACCTLWDALQITAVRVHCIQIH